MQHDLVSVYADFFFCCVFLEDIIVIDGGQHVNLSAWMHNFGKTCKGEKNSLHLKAFTSYWSGG